uniref:Uncharacterized protein n=1 Tax=Rhizophora mucronata TaxID=61149 RepID=A0A2P2Q9G9_RHIMU
MDYHPVKHLPFKGLLQLSLITSIDQLVNVHSKSHSRGQLVNLLHKLKLTFCMSPQVQEGHILQPLTPVRAMNF